MGLSGEATAQAAGAEGDSAREVWTVGKLMSWTAGYLARQGSESPRLDAEVLLAHALGCPRVQLYTRYDQEVSEAHRGVYRELVKRRAEGMPVAYLIGKKEFFSLPFRVTPAVLIPRPDTETVLTVFEDLFRERLEPAPRVVDVGTGSGCIAIACAHIHATARIWATDRSAEALEVARGNAQALGYAERITFREGDLLEAVAGEGPFDAILSNPPYIPTEEIAKLERGVRDYEPWGALDGGPDGLDVVRRLVEQAVPLLAAGGHLILEIGTAQELPVRALLREQAGLIVAPTVRDAANHPRVVWATKAG
jgi:release factor glutamine methyltransferase